MKRHKWKVTGSIAAVVTVALTAAALDLVLGRQVLHGWDVAVSARVVDATTGASVPNVRARWSLDGLHPHDVADLHQVGDTVSFTMTMKYCRGEGRALSWFWPKPRPRPEWYTLTYEADGYVATDLAGGAGELIKDPAKLGRFEFAYRLSPVRLRPADATASNQALERPGASSSASIETPLAAGRSAP